MKFRTDYLCAPIAYSVKFKRLEVYSVKFVSPDGNSRLKQNEPFIFIVKSLFCFFDLLFYAFNRFKR